MRWNQSWRTLIVLVGWSLLMASVSPLRAQPLQADDDGLTSLAAPAAGPMSPIQRVAIYLVIVIIAFSLFMVGIYRAALSRHGWWPGTLYGVCLGLFLATCLLAVIPLFLEPYRQLEWVRNIGGPVESMGLQIGSITSAVLAFLLSWRLNRSQPVTA